MKKIILFLILIPSISFGGTINIIGETISDHLKQNGSVIFSSHIPVSLTNKKYIDLDMHE